MQRTLRNLAVALVAGTFAVAAGAQDKAEKAPRKSAAASASGHFAASTSDELTRLYGDFYAGSGTYHANFWDITYGSCNFYSGSFSVGGYDLCTGLGSPKGLGGK